TGKSGSDTDSDSESKSDIDTDMNDTAAKKCGVEGVVEADKVSDEKGHPQWWEKRLVSHSLSEICVCVYPDSDIGLASQQSILDERASRTSEIILSLLLARKGHGDVDIEGSVGKHLTSK
ncbi:hypothetical protein V5O48_019513, partial [Marasmius crinis-equi]